MNQIILKNIKKSFGTSIVLDNVTYCFNKSNSYALKGVSGSGKSTLLHIIAGLDAPTAGTLHFDTTERTHLTYSQKEALLHKNMGLVFQAPYLIKELSVLDNVLIKKKFSNTTNSELTEQAISLLETLKLKEKIYSHPSSLSGGQQQRVSLARALIHKPDFLIADEPTAHVDHQTKDVLIEVIMNYHQSYSMGIIISSHDLSIIERMSYTITLEQGFLKQG